MKVNFKLNEAGNMTLKEHLDTKNIYEAVYNLIEIANTNLPPWVYNKLSNFNCDYKDKILKNAYLAQSKKRPLCQDTGQVVIFIELGQNIILEGEYIENAINKAVADCYRDKFYRKSTVSDALNDRTNKGDNTPALIHTKIVEGSEISILVGIKGGGAENMTRLKMFNPTAEYQEILDFAKQCAIDAGENACPPMCIGIGAGGCAETAAFLAKKALFTGKSVEVDIENVFETRILTAPTHIACLPVCVNISCHSFRAASAKIKNGEIRYISEFQKFSDVNIASNAREIRTDDLSALQNLKDGEEILLTGKIITARDAAHKKLADMIEAGYKNPNAENTCYDKILPVDLNNKIIFYAGPCPASREEIIGPIGPTTSKRMDKFAPLLYKNGVIATIGKGDRAINGLNKLYFKANGGIACVLQACIKDCTLICFEELGTEAIYELTVEKLPLKTIWL